MPGMTGAAATEPAGDQSTADGEVDDSLDPGGDTQFVLDAAGGGDGSSNPCGTVLVGTLRDFDSSHPDFERDVVGEDPGIVAALLGDDGKPVYAGGTTGTTTDAAAFDQWFRDVDGVNVALPIAFALDEETPGSFVFADGTFFPADGAGFGDQGNPHNYHFTVELRGQFEYKGGEVFTFRGDDDLFTFVNGHLGIDLGGVHLPLTRTIDMDAVADEFGLEIGETYALEFFFAERHTTLSNFRIETSIECFVPVG
ncbi:MAG: fibro-slime domain-containing protein [Deltaproteobacteria bacterium]|nr:fibro-slime domain-containing protein [Nannocystaceae bacterium]